MEYRRQEIETELHVYRRVLEDAETSTGVEPELPSARQAILDLLHRQPATTGELVSKLKGKFKTQSSKPKSAIYAAVDYLKRRELIVNTPENPRQYMLKNER
jgi:hypothetical protein